MSRVHSALLALNRGEVSKDALARVDIERLRLSAETQENYLPFTLGPMMLRPGYEYCGEVRSSLPGRLLPFVFSNSDTALVELTDGTMRVWLVDEDDETLLQRPVHGDAIIAGDFSATTGWTLTASGAGAAATIGSGVLTLVSPSVGGIASAKKQVSIAGFYIEHAIRIVVRRGPVTFRAGSVDGADNYIAETTLNTGTHSLAVTPVSDIFIQLSTTSGSSKLIDGVTFETPGTMEIPTSWSAGNLSDIRHVQSGDVLFCACYRQPPKRIERRGLRSWSFADYVFTDGPFGTANGTDITMTPDTLNGNGTLTSSRPYFNFGHEGTLFRLFSAGQTATASLAASNTFTSAIRITGVDAARNFARIITGTWSGTVTMQRSFDSATTGFSDVAFWTGNVSDTFGDALNNSIAWYRLGFKAGDYTSGTAVATLQTPLGGAAGICRIVTVLSTTTAGYEIVTPFSSLTSTIQWNEGDWSDMRGWPDAVTIQEGRLWWSGRDKIWGSVSDAYSSFDLDFEGDAGPINRTLGSGPVDRINWILPLTRLIVGREGSEASIRSSSFDEPLTPTNFSIKDCSTQGSSPDIAAVKVDTRGVFVQKSKRRVYELAYNIDAQDYKARDLTRLHSKIGESGFFSIAIQRQPDTVIHFQRGDGQLASLVYDSDDAVECWWRTTTAGEFENVVVLPGNIEDKVYGIIKRTIGGVERRYIERSARRDQCQGQPEARCADSHIIYQGGPTGTIDGLDHLEGETVVAWAWNNDDELGIDLGTFTVAGGAIVLTGPPYENFCIGLGYTANFKSAKLAYGAQMGTALNQKKRIESLGMILLDAHTQGIKYGQDFDHLNDMPMIEDGAEVDPGHVWEEYDKPMFSMNGTWDTDSRLCLRSAAPRPCTVAAIVISTQTNEKT